MIQPLCVEHDRSPQHQLLINQDKIYVFSVLGEVYFVPEDVDLLGDLDLLLGEDNRGFPSLHLPKGDFEGRITQSGGGEVLIVWVLQRVFVSGLHIDQMVQNLRFPDSRD